MSSATQMFGIPQIFHESVKLVYSAKVTVFGVFHFLFETADDAEFGVFLFLKIKWFYSTHTKEDSTISLHN